MKKQYFSLRKHKLGLVSVMIGASLFLISPNAHANETLVTPPVSEDTTVTVSSPLETTSDTTSTLVESNEESTPANTNNTEDNTATVVEKTTSPQPEATSQLTSDTAPTATVPLNKSSNEIVNVAPAWEEGYKGEGMVVAIIDSGVDIEHDALRLSDVSKAKYKNEQQIEEAKQAAGIDYGKWYSDKVIFGYNYVDANTNLKEVNEHSHGMHVTGISAGNPSKVDSSGELITGVAPEAQVMFMRVFVDRNKTTDTPLYARAIEDAVKLGADSINLSLGSTTGSVVDTDQSVITAIAKARQAGVTVTIAAGNDGYFGSGAGKPLASNPDYGLVGSPSTAKDAISVASFNNTTKTSEVITIVGQENNDALNHGKSIFTLPGGEVPLFEKGKIFDYVFVNLGKEEDFENIDLTDKVALIKRGEITFTEKINRARENGAIGAIVFNNRENGDGDNLTMSVSDDATKIPSVFLPYSIGNVLSQGNYQLQFNGEYLIQPNSEAGKLSDFSSWGLTTDGELKPDLTAPGGAIYSSINNGKYASMNGTSMAAPHVAGAALLVKQRLLEKFPDKSPAEIEKLVKHLLMSTAKPYIDQEAKTYNSPRQQGAGIMDTHQALHSDLYLTGANDYGSLSLGNVKSHFNFDVFVHNISNEAKTVKYNTTLLTDEIEDGHVTLLPRQLLQLEGTTLTIAPNSSKKITIDIDASQFDKELKEQMPNGYYLEGFVNFTELNSDKHLVSIPYVGFKGQFQNLPVAEDNIYNLVKNNKKGFYFSLDEDKEIPTDANYTGLVTASTANEKPAITALGTFENEDGKFILHTNDKGNVTLAISPNDDDMQDSTAFKGVFLRNYTHLKATVYALEDQKLSRILWRSSATSGAKNYYSGNEDNPKSDMLLSTEWDGKDSKGNLLPDGKYQYIVAYRPDIPGAKPQTMKFIVSIDTKAPIITTATYDTTTRLFKPRQIIEQGSGIAQQVITYVEKDEEGQEKRHFINPDEAGNFTLPEHIKLEDLSFTVKDFAGNSDTVKVESLIANDNNSGRVLIKTINHATQKPEKMTLTYTVKDAQGRIVENIDKSKEGIALPFGKYTINVLLYDTDNARLVSEATQAVEVTETNSLQTVNFEFEPIKYTPFTVAFNQPLPPNSQVTLIDSNGKTFILPAEKYLAAGFGKRVPVGQYTINIQLAPNYDIYEQNLSVKIKNLENPIKHLTLINKTTLALLTTQVQSITSEPLYYNADITKQQTYQQALEEAKNALTTPHTQLEVDQLTTHLQTAVAALNGQPTDNSTLQQALNQTITEQAVYFNASPELQTAYQQAREAAKQALDAKLQSDVDSALNKLQVAIKALNGANTNYDALQQALNQAITEQAVYFNASPELQTAYQQTREAAKQALDAKLQSDVDSALTKLQVAIKALNGANTNYDALQQALNQTITEQAVYFNASPELQTAYQQAREAAKQALDAKLQSDVDSALNKLQVAIKALNGANTNYDALQQALNQAITEQAVYFNASPELQTAYQQTREAAKQALDAKLQSDVDSALTKLQVAIKALNGANTNYSALQQALNQTITEQAVYFNASSELQTAYQQAREAAKQGLNAKLQSDVDNALNKLQAATKALNGVNTNYDALQQALNQAVTEQAVYFNASPELQTAYQQAREAAKQALDAKLQSDVDSALTKLQVAIKALNGANTNYDALQQALNQTITEQAVYFNASPELQTAYQQAREAAKQGLNAKLQSDVDSALTKLQAATQALNGANTNYSALQQALNQAVTEQALYFNASPELQTAYQQAREAAKQALNAKLQSDVDSALTKLQVAIKALNGANTNYSALNALIEQDKAFISTASQYIYANKDKQLAYQQALALAKAVLNNAQSTQQQVDEVLATLTETKSQLDGRAPVVSIPREKITQVTKTNTSITESLVARKTSHKEQTNSETINKTTLNHTDDKLVANNNKQVTTLPKTGQSTIPASLLGSMAVIFALIVNSRRKNN